MLGLFEAVSNRNRIPPLISSSIEWLSTNCLSISLLASVWSALSPILFYWVVASDRSSVPSLPRPQSTPSIPRHAIRVLRIAFIAFKRILSERPRISRTALTEWSRVETIWKCGIRISDAISDKLQLFWFFALRLRQRSICSLLTIIFFDQNRVKNCFDESVG